jgi:group I intron endonuclease
MKTGIYSITENITGRSYIGRSVRMRARIQGHFWRLRAGCHNNPHLQAAFNKHGEGAFSVKVLLVCQKAELPMYERRAIRVFRAAEREHGFNQMGSLDEHYVHSDEAKQKSSDFNRKRWKDPTYRRQRSAIQRQTIARQWEDPAFRELRSKAASEQWADPARRARFAARQSVAQTALWEDPAYRERQRAARTAAWKDPERRRNHLAAMKAAWADPVYRARQTADRASRPRGPDGRLLPRGVK